MIHVGAIIGAAVAQGRIRHMGPATFPSFWAILFILGHFPRISKLHPTPHAPHALLYLVPMPNGC